MLLALALAACHAKPRPAAAATTHTDLAGVRQLLNVPGMPASVMWCEGPLADPFPGGVAPGPSDYKVEALLTYSTSARASITTALATATTNGGDSVVGHCFPSADVPKVLGALNGKTRDLGPVARSPLINGFLIWDEHDATLFVYAHTM